MEVWKDIEGFENKYQVSTEGNVKSLNYNNTHQERLLKPKINRYGYREVQLSKNNKTKNYLISTLVGRAFLKQPAPDMEIMHINDSQDDSVDNLMYAYRSQILHATYKRGKRKIGKPSANTISYFGKGYKNISKLAKDHGIKGHEVYKRISRGWTLEEALEIPLHRPNNKKILNVQLYEYNGKLLPVKEISRQCGINAKALYKRLARGWSIEEATEIPLAKLKVNERK